MLTYSPEEAFFLTLFELVVSGVALAALLWIRFWERARFPAAFLIAGCALLGMGFAAEGAHYRLAVFPSGSPASHDWLFVAAEVARLLASLCLGAGCLVWNGRHARARVFGVAGLAVTAIAFAQVPYDQGALLGSIDPLTALRLADVLVLAVAALLLGAPGLATVALVLLALGRASAAVGAWWPDLTEAAWSAGCALTLMGLMAFALALERASQRRLLQYVLRFNLTFLTLAVSLILVLAEISRWQFIEYSALQTHDVAEFARGQLLYREAAGAEPASVLAEPRLAAGIIREFGRYPDLRRVWLELRGHSMALDIEANGEVDQQFWSGERPDSPPVAPADFTRALLLREPVVVDGQTVGRVELHHSVVRINTRIGQQMQVAFGVFTVFVVLGSLVTGILVLVADRTIRRQEIELSAAQRRLLRSERLASIGAVADGVAHEINNPAGVLVARSDYLLSLVGGTPEGRAIQDDLDTIRRQAQRIARTVQDLLTSTRQARRAHGPVPIAAVVDSALRLAQPVIHNRGVTFETTPIPGHLRVWGDRDRLEQVLVNLLLNGAQAIPGRGHVRVDAYEEADRSAVVVVVADTGAGIPPEHLSRIFDRFFTTKEPGGGSGLGLSIVRGIVQEHGGDIAVESVPGAGTTFRVTLRANRPAVERSSSAVAFSGETTGSPPTEAVDG